MKQKQNDLFYTCSLIDYIAKKTKNVRADIVNQLGKERIVKIYELADVYHCDNIERVAEDFIAEANIKAGTFDNVRADIVNQLGKERIEKIDDYNSSLYYENPSYIFTCYEENKMI